MGILKEKLRPFEGEVATIEEGKSSLRLVRKRIHELKVGIGDLKRKARLAMIAAQKEKDKMLLAQGNQGYLVKDSKPVQSSFPVQKQEKKFKINVTLFE